MFTKINPATDSQLSNEDVANLMVNEALNNISKLTGLNQEQAFALLLSQVSRQTEQVSRQTEQVSLESTSKVHSPLLEVDETQFIASLFN
ncbi:hypothetical protein CMT41_04430 [Colwellia sp. MT41]|uniref:hypothetical protein n=1 Tax=Colwellia sp. MT41 TaxID=58049 RepID=UPI0007178D85|nr:hypothetical protein [Colwellia sp. MT41]ALO34055.1 hypothetical protein CMT41_04430 [Colwellia sp. MT41]